MLKISGIFILAIGLTISFSIPICFSNPSSGVNANQKKQALASDEIVFYSNGSTFSPVIVLQAAAEVLWTWDDNSTSNSLTPTKDYGSVQLRPNRLKVTPWSAIRRINIGYTAEDGGAGNIELVPDQHVSLVENLSLAAPYLKEWCSSYNDIKSLDFSNFVNIETIECYLSTSLNEVNLTNTPKLKRACFEDNNLLSLNLSDCNSLEDIRGALNKYNTIKFPTQKENIWHICIRDNLQIIDQQLFYNLGPLPKIAEIIIGNSNQKGVLKIPQTNPNRTVAIHAEANHFSSIDFRGSLLNVNAGGIIYLQYNKLTAVDISGCIQIKKLDLRYNLLTSEVVDNVLKQVDEYGTNNGTIDLRYNKPPTISGLIYKTNLENRGWTVNTDQIIPVESIFVSSALGTSITTDNGILQLSASILPANATTKTVSWSVVNLTGKASISSSGLVTAQKDGTVKAVATATDGSGITGELTITISNQVIPVETISVSSASGALITTDNGTLQLSASILPADATTKTVSWSVVDLTGKASISSSGLVTAEKDGTVKAVATATDGSGITGELTITISNQLILIESIQIIDNLANDTINGVGTEVTYKVNITPKNATNQLVDWNVENISGQANINSVGLLTTISPGLIRVIVKAKDESKHVDQREYTIAIPLANQNDKERSDIEIFPNPTSGKFFVLINDFHIEGVRLEILNSYGQSLIHRNIDNSVSEWSLDQFSGNIFFIIINNNKARTILKLIKN